jgi:putative flavoprotein involved in K+ transport
MLLTPDTDVAAPTRPESDAEAAVIGAGSAGLWAAAELKRRGVQVAVLERTAAVGTSWRRRYDGLRLNTVRWLSGVPNASALLEPR